MARPDERLVIRSYRRVFQIDRRIYRVDRWALPVPDGISLRSIAYAAVALCLILLLGAFPGPAQLLSLLSPPLRYVVLPIAVAMLLRNVTPDGRVAHRAAVDYGLFLVRTRILPGGRSSGRRIPRDAMHVNATLTQADDA